ncbi:hypothetical protein GW17_00023820 [Ensete ventricosum]|nr:hypothetical protein GW17_00023820 [Ensete ventricosum]RZS02605.1 hypothetical protein BHM03_00032664 [Ensete ventricosum]
MAKVTVRDAPVWFPSDIRAKGRLLLARAPVRVVACGQATYRGGRLRPLLLASAIARGQPTRGDACTRPGCWGDAYPLGRLPEGRSSRPWGRSPRTEVGDGGAQHCRFRMGGGWKRAERRVRVFSLVKRL